MGTALEKPARPKRVNSRPLAELVNRALDPLVARQGFGEATLLTQWETIVGARLAAMCEPVRLNWPPRAKKPVPGAEPQPATLTLRVEPGFGLDVQHMSGALIERVNTHLGWRCVARQEPIRRAAPKRAPPPPDLDAQALAREATTGIESEALRAALIGLGEHALSKKMKDE
jgi:hypothetical protein